MPRHFAAALCTVVLFAAPAPAATAGAATKTDVRNLEFSVLGMTCGTCANSASELLRKVSGVRQARVDFDTKAAHVVAAAEVSQDDIRSALAAFGFEAQFPGDPPIPAALTEEQKQDLDIQTVSHGEAIRIKDHLAPGKTTIFDYYAEWCGPCHLLSPRLERLVLNDENIALRTVDISDWESEAGKQATRKFKIPGLPYVRVYGPRGKFLGAVEGNQIEKVKELIGKVSAP